MPVCSRLWFLQQIHRLAISALTLYRVLCGGHYGTWSCAPTYDYGADAIVLLLSSSMRATGDIGPT